MEVAVGEVVDFAQARKRLERIQVKDNETSSLQRNASVADELKVKIAAHSTCTYWPNPSAPAVYVSMPLISALSRDAMRALRDMIVTIVMREVGEDVSYRCSVMNVRQEDYEVQFHLTLRGSELQSSFEVGVMSGAVTRMSFALAGFRVVRDRLRHEFVSPF